jgi:predicted metal-dependent hydrolase
LTTGSSGVCPQAALLLIARWEVRLGVKTEKLFIRRMKTQWSSCNPHARSVRLNTDLAKKPPQCLEYLVVHELVHPLEPTHNARFISLMDHHMPICYPEWISRPKST